MFKKNNILKHNVEKPYYPTIVPSKKIIPEWYKKTDRNAFDIKNDNRMPIQRTLKACMPFFEAMSSGYMIPLFTDISIKQTEGGPSIAFNPNGEPPITLRSPKSDYGTGNSTLPIPNGYSDLHFAWSTKVVLDIPKGYSFLFTHPLNRFDLPFITLSGIVDGEYAMFGGNVPVYFNTSFEGIIPAGTPIMQIIPFKTENWKSELNDETLIRSSINYQKSNSIDSFYKKNFWNKKTYQ